MNVHASELSPPPSWRRPLAWLVGLPAGAAVILFGVWLFGARLGPGYWGSIGFTTGWFVVSWMAIGRIRRVAPELLWPLRVAYLAIVIVVGGYSALTTFTDKVVNEQIVTGVPQSGGGSGANVERARGAFQPLVHSARGTAAVVELTGGDRVLTFQGLDTDNGPDLRVYLVAGRVSGDGDVGDFVDLGALKGNKGNQQYVIPAGTDVEKYATVLIWCRAFSVAFAKAELKAS